MPGPVPSLGFPSRSKAILALRMRGLTTSEIAEQVGVPQKTVTAFEANACQRARPARMAPIGAIRMSRISDHFDPSVIDLLRPAAEKRHISVDSLIRKLAVTVAREAIVDAVLDDDETSQPAQADAE